MPRPSPRTGPSGSAAAARRVAIPSGSAYLARGVSPATAIRSALAAELRNVLDRFATDAGFGPGSRIAIEFRPGVVGHHKTGRAADIYGVGGVGIGEWKMRWDAAHRLAARTPDRAAAEGTVQRERSRNLGWRLYRALRDGGHWAQPPGYPVQLFGPWTRSEGPHRKVSDEILRAHRDHIHIAK